MQPSEPHAAATEIPQRLHRALGPLAAGMLIDLVDLITFAPIGLVLGIPAGAVAGYWLGKCLGFDRRSSLLCAGAAAVYCTIPFTEFLPLGSLLGAYARFWDLPAPVNVPPASASTTSPAPETVEGIILSRSVQAAEAHPGPARPGTG